MQITFNLPKLGRSLGQSYYLKSGDKMYSAEWRVGDEVSVMFALWKGQIPSIERNLKFFPRGYGNDTIHIPCKVKRRFHAIVWKQVGEFQAVCNGDVLLEPTSKRWEELLLWVATNETPRWADELCASCYGKGTMAQLPCAHCNGSGVEPK